MVVITVLISILLALALINVIITVREYVKEKRFKRLVDHLLIRIVAKCRCTGHIHCPAFDDDTVYDVELGCDMYEFLEIRDDNMQRMIFVSKNGEHVKALPWRDAEMLDDDVEECG